MEKNLLLDNKENVVAYFRPEVEEVRFENELNGEGHSEMVLKLKIFIGEKYKTIEVTDTELQKQCWNRIDAHFRVNPSYQHPEKYIRGYIEKQISQATPVEIKTATTPGIHRYSANAVVFVSSNRVITPSGSGITDVSPGKNLKGFSLEIEDMTIYECFQGVKELVGAKPECGKVLLSFAIAGIVRQAFEEVGFELTTVLYILGKSGTLKSHYTPLIVQLYNRKSGIRPTTRLNSSLSYIEKVLCANRGMTSIIDDLHTAETAAIRRDNERKFEEIDRRISDNVGRGHMEGVSLVQSKFEGNVVMIGEYLYGKASTIPRYLTLSFDEAPASEIVDKYQRECPLLMSTFYYYFIQWLVDNYCQVVGELRMQLTAYRKIVAEASMHGRIIDSVFLLQSSYNLLLEFLIEEGCIAREAAVREYEIFKDIVNALAEQQQEYYDNAEKADKGEFYALILKRKIDCDAFCIALDKKECEDRTFDGYRDENYLYLRGESLKRVLSAEIAGFDFNKCKKKLLEEKIIIRGTDKISVQRCHSMRFYMIDETALSDYA